MLLHTSVRLNPNIMNFELDRLKFELTRTQVHPTKLNFKLIRTPPKSPDLETVQPEMGQTQAQI